jgi:branched-subunit amino acid transport protein
MSWLFVAVLAVCAFGFKALGLIVVGDRALPPIVERCLMLIPAALIAALVVKDTLSSGQELVVDPRAAGVGVAIVAAWRKAPLIVVIVLAAVVTAGLRQLT